MFGRTTLTADSTLVVVGQAWEVALDFLVYSVLDLHHSVDKSLRIVRAFRDVVFETSNLLIFIL